MITLVNTTCNSRESVFFQPVLKAYPTHHSWMITTHVSLGNLEKQWKLFTQQMIRTHQILPSLLQIPEAPTQLLSGLIGLIAELSNLNNIYTSYQPLIQEATQILLTEPSFNSIPVSSKHMKRSLLPFLGDTLSWLTGTVTTKDVNAIKSRINQLISTWMNQQETLVHMIAIINVTRYATQVNRHHINILMDATEKTHQDKTTLYNIMHSLYSSTSYHQIILHVRSVLANLQDSLHYMWEIALHTWIIKMQPPQEYSSHVFYLPRIWGRCWNTLRIHSLPWCTYPFHWTTLYISTDIYAPMCSSWMNNSSY